MGVSTDDLADDLLRAAARLSRWANRHADLGLPWAQARVLALVDELGPARITALAAADDSSQPTMTTQVQRLEADGLVTRIPDPADGRGKLVTLTPAAEPVVALGEAEWAATEAAVAELEAESEHALSAVVTDLELRLAERSFGERVRAHLDDAR